MRLPFILVTDVQQLRIAGIRGTLTWAKLFVWAESSSDVRERRPYTFQSSNP
jgi:hypothetical protein